MKGDIHLKINKKVGLFFLGIFAMFSLADYVSLVDVESAGGVTIVQPINESVPVGAISMWGTSTPPEGWLEMNGQSTADYPELALLYGATLPDMRGEYIRGWDSSRGVDSGRAIFTAQSGSVGTHNHDIAFGSYGIVSARQTVNGAGNNGVFSHYRYGNGNTYSNPHDSDTARAIGQYRGNAMSSENLVRNISVMFIVKAK
jgi:microcystin-dependent protein